MSDARSQVQVSIVASLGKGFDAVFTSADKRMSSLGKAAQDLSRKVGDIQGFHKQRNAVKDAGRAWQEARTKAAQLRAELAAVEKPTRAQTAALARAEAQVRRTSAAYTEARTKLGAMSGELVKAGVNVAKLSGEYRRLQGELQVATNKHEKMEKSLERQQRIVSAMGRGWKAIQQHAAGAMAAGAVVGMAGRKALPYDEQLARLADTATAGKSLEEYKGAKTALSKAVQDALKAAGGGTREEVLSGLNELIAQGNLSVADATKLLPMIAKGSFGSGTSGKDIASLVLKMRQFGVDPGAGLDIAMRGGQAGGVELADMARFLPEQLASARSAGYSGDKGLAAIVAMNQIALGTAGNADQASNNVTNLLNKLSSPELAKNVKKQTGTDFDSYALKNMGQGIYKAESFAMLADKQMQSDPKYRALKKRAEGAKGGEQASVINEMAAMMEGSGMGSLIQDRQALAAALAMMFARRVDPATGKSDLSVMNDKVLNGQGGIENSAGRLRGETFASVQRANEGINAANENAFNSLSGPIGGVMDGFTKLTEQFPKLTSAAYGATFALGAIAAYGLGGGVVGKILGGGAGAAAGAAAGGAGAGAAAAGGAAAGAAGRGVLGRLMARGAGFGRLGVAGLLSWGAMEAGEATGVLKQNDEARGSEAFKKGNYFEASRYMGAGSFLGAIWDKMTAKNGEKEAEATKQATAAATAASEAAKAAQSRPNVTMNNNYSISVQAAPQAGAAELAAQIQKEIRINDAKRAAESRSIMFDKLGH